ncbi:hypothetical protein NitYY0826_C0661 [Nitratiruptor sp. YY08-26]|uniref:hypothetical protein n=1 Tax=unclassified Nitratiruptor TaxID=2624044 RepID=UPI001915246C|nr:MULTISPECIES: hypothetical protein [unclassified Nitratiruptor]BCD61798.1 hypothetical protein NitYY0813_C0659 [Nitratiruptor sp. YY08-13]BCD65733.1 hypothetical protein NitYY0826_C0661 [Nitratiruptor sp. YY08-26]
MFINRFPKMAALQKFRAIALGFNEKIAEAIGIAEATKYAIFKNLSYRKRREKEREYVTKKLKKAPENLDEETFALFKLQALNGFPFVGEKTYTSEDYNRAVFMKFGEEAGKKIEEWAKNIIDSCDKALLENEQKFFNECWKPHRDENPLKN